MDLEQSRAVVVVLDGLGAGWLGPYGNTWIETPTFNLLASQSCLMEQAIIEAPTIERMYDSVWSGRHAAHPETLTDFREGLPSWLAQAGRSSVLVTDELACAEHPLAEAFERTLLVAVEDRLAVAAEDTGIARLLAAAVEALGDDPAPLTWIHGQAMRGAWDAPLELRHQFADEDDPPPPDSAEPPSFWLPADHDPDLLQGWLWAYAGQLVLLDLCLQPFLAMLEQWDPSPLLIVMGARGYPLGEHRALGGAARGLYSELLHVPLLIRWPDRTWAMHRVHRLVQPSQIAATLLQWLGLDPHLARSESLFPVLHDDRKPAPELAVSAGWQQWALRTPAWLARVSPDACELFVKPDDQWDVNDVADRCPEVVQAFHRLLDQLRSDPDAPGWPGALPIDDLLLQEP